MRSCSRSNVAFSTGHPAFWECWGRLGVRSRLARGVLLKCEHFTGFRVLPHTSGTRKRDRGPEGLKIWDPHMHLSSCYSDNWRRLYCLGYPSHMAHSQNSDLHPGCTQPVSPFPNHCQGPWHSGISDEQLHCVFKQWPREADFYNPLTYTDLLNKWPKTMWGESGLTQEHPVVLAWLVHRCVILQSAVVYLLFLVLECFQTASSPES